MEELFKWQRNKCDDILDKLSSQAGIMVRNSEFVNTQFSTATASAATVALVNTLHHSARSFVLCTLGVESAKYKSV